MYMPPTVKTSYKSEYTDTTVGAFSGKAIDAINSLKQGADVTDPAVKEKLTSAVTGGAEAAVRGVARELGGGIVEQMEMSVLQRELQSLKLGIMSFRNFSKNFKFFKILP